MRYLFSILILTAIIGCNKQDGAEGEKIVVLFDKTVLREGPSEKSQEIRQLKAAEVATDLGEVSKTTSKIKLENRMREEPWIKIETIKGDTGWVFAGAINLYTKDVQLRKDWLHRKRMECYFGKAFSTRMLQHFRQPAPTTEGAAATFYRESKQITDSLNHILKKTISVDAEGQLPDMYWLGDFTHLWIVQQVKEGTAFHLFFDYRPFATMAQNTTGNQDDYFFRACCKAFEVDSIESFYPTWMIQTDELVGYSNLGSGQHLQTLNTIEQAMGKGDLFKQELKSLKDSLLEDILGKKSKYWQPQASILKEMESIIQNNYQCLIDQDKIALETRMEMFKSPQENGLQVNLRAGND